MAYQPLGQVAADYCAIVIYGLCHRIFFFFLKRAWFKQRQFNLQWISFCFFSTSCYTVSNKSQSFVILSLSFLYFFVSRPSVGMVSEDKGEEEVRRGQASALELWLRDWVSFGSDKPMTFRPAVCRGVNCSIYWSLSGHTENHKDLKSTSGVLLLSFCHSFTIKRQDMTK